MRYEDMPKGRNKDRCVRCGKRYNFADKALSKAKVPYDLLCLAEVTASGYMTHGNVKLCDECMAELLMWLDRKTENSSEKPNNSTTEDCSMVETQTDYGDFTGRLAYERGVKHAWEVAQKVFDSTVTFYEAEDVAKQIVKDEPTISKMEQVDKDINVRSKTMLDCYKCRRYADPTEPCVECHYEPKTEPQTERAETMSCQECKWWFTDSLKHGGYCQSLLYNHECRYEPEVDCSWK